MTNTETPAIAGTMCECCRQYAVPYPSDPPFICVLCTSTLPHSLIKATYDSFDYAMKLRTGEVIRFREAKIHGAFVTLNIDQNGGTDKRHYNDFSFERGLDVRLSDIVWCADAPDGS